MDIVEESAGWRVRLVSDDDAEQPYDDGATPILCLMPGGYNGYSVEAFNSQAAPYVDAAQRLLHLGQDALERYLGIFHGAVSVQSYGINDSRATDNVYIAFDTAAWRESMGITDLDRLKSENYLSEVRAWLEGDTYGYIVERFREYTKLYSDGSTEEGEEWELVDSCYGYYGREYAEETARQALGQIT